MKNRFGSRTFTTMIYRYAKKVVPKISQTERAALECGTIGIDKEIFNGTLNLEKLRGYNASLSDREKKYLKEVVNPLCETLDDNAIMKNQDMSPDNWNSIKKSGLLGMLIPEKYGGLNFSSHGRSKIVERIATRSGSAATSVMVPNSLGPAELLLKYGTEEQKDKYLPKLATGELVPCFGLTGEYNGSDAAGSMKDVGIVRKEKDGLVIELHLNKRYITLAPIAHLIGAAFKLEDPDNLLKKGTPGITVALLDRNTPGLQIGNRHNPLGAAFMNGTIKADGVKIPIENVIGGEERAGFGWNMLMECLAEGRGVSLPATGTATATMSLFAVGAYSRAREQFNTPVAKLEGVQEKLANIASETYTSLAAQRLMNAMLDNHEKPSVLSAVMKQQLTEKGRNVINDAMDVAGGIGICKGSQNFLANSYIQAPIAITVEGSNTLTRSLIIYGQGLVRSHPHLFPMLETIRNGNDLPGFRKELYALVGHGARNFAGSLYYSHFRKRIKNQRNFIQYYENHLGKAISNFAIFADFSLLLGGKLKFAEMVSGRFADLFSNIYLGYSILLDYDQVVCNLPESEKERYYDLASYSLDKILYDIQETTYDLTDNYPSKVVGKLLKLLSYPYGKIYKMPNDDRKKRLADIISMPNGTRDILCENVYIPENKDDNMRRLYNFMEALEKGNMTKEELNKLKYEIIRVNEYPFDQFP